MVNHCEKPPFGRIGLLLFSRHQAVANPRSSLSLVRKRLVNDLSYTEAQVLRATKAKTLAELSFGGKRFQEELKLGSEIV